MDLNQGWWSTLNIFKRMILQVLCSHCEQSSAKCSSYEDDMKFLIKCKSIYFCLNYHEYCSLAGTVTKKRHWSSSTVLLRSCFILEGDIRGSNLVKLEQAVTFTACFQAKCRLPIWTKIWRALYQTKDRERFKKQLFCSEQRST